MTDPTAVSATSPKPGILTTEFALSALAHALGWLMASGVIADGSTWARAIGAALALISFLGYGAMRTIVKTAAALLFVVLLSQQMSCGGAQKAAEHAALVCAESAAVKDLTPTAESILVNGAPSGAAGWEAQLVALGVAFGSDVVNCAVVAAQASLHATVGAGSGNAATAIDRADAWIRKHGQ